MKLYQCVVLICIVATNVVRSWWENGHMLAAQIAEIHLQKYNPAAYKRANDIVLAMNGLDYDYDNTFVTAAVWPDDIKDKAMDFWEGWHFLDRPVNPQGEYIMQSVDGSVNNAMSALKRAQLEFKKDDGSITMQKAMFMRYVLHVVGDVHQPLHSASMYNKTYGNPLGDMGGNAEEIYDPEGVKMNLHAFWDQGAEYFQQNGKNFIERPFNASTAAFMESWARDLMKEFPEDSFHGKQKNLDYYEWTRESWQVSEEFVYPLIYQTNKLTKDYQTQGQQICKERVTLAGYRLSYFIENLFADYLSGKYTNQSNDVKKHIDYHDSLQSESQGNNLKQQARSDNSFLQKFFTEFTKQQNTNQN